MSLREELSETLAKTVQEKQETDTGVSVEDFDKQDGEWIPYEGPLGGQGWQNIETGEVRYQDDPPEGGVFQTVGAESLTEDLTSIHDAFSYPVEGDTVMVLPTPEYHDEDGYHPSVPRDGPEDFAPGEDDREPFVGKYVGHGGDYAAQMTWAIVEDENGEQHQIYQDRLFVVDGQMPDEGEPIELDDIHSNDVVRQMKGDGETEDFIVTGQDSETGKVEAWSLDYETSTTLSEGDRLSRIGHRDKIEEPQILINRVEWGDFGWGEDLTEDEAKEQFSELYERTDEKVARETINSLNRIYNKSDKNAWHGKKDNIQFKETADESVVAHEFMHALLESRYGYSYNKGMTIFAKFHVNTFPPYKFGEPKKEVFSDLLAERLEEAEADEETVENQREHAIDLAETAMKNADEALEREDFLLRKPEYVDEEEIPDSLQRFVESVNSAWEETFDAYEEGGVSEAEQVMPYRPYAVTNAHELAAGVQEIMNADNGDEAHIRGIMDHHPELVESYLNLVEPSERAKEVMELHTEHGDPAFEFDRGEWEW